MLVVGCSARLATDVVVVMLCLRVVVLGIVGYVVDVCRAADICCVVLVG